MGILSDFDKRLAAVSDIAVSSYARLLREDVALVEAQATGSSELTRRLGQFRKQLTQQLFALDPQAIEGFAQGLAEAQFLALSEQRGVQLDAVSTQTGKRTPDFSLRGAPDTTFEVKALSVVDGHHGIERGLYQELAAQIDLEAQVKKRHPTAFVETETAAYGNKLRRDATNFDHINVLLNKIHQNIKLGQFAAPRSFLVLNATLLPTLGPRLAGLRPIYWNDGPPPHPVSGAAWMLAFGRIGMAVFGHPEFEGRPSIEGYFEKLGILHQYPGISGMLIVRRTLGGRLDTGALMRSEDWQDWSAGEGEGNPIRLLVGPDWNDELDSNGGRCNS